MPEGGPPDPSLSTEQEIKQTLTESTSVESGLSFGETETSSKEHLVAAASALTDALATESAKSDEAIGELAVHEVRDAIGRGLDPSEVLGAALSSGAVPMDVVEQLAWNVARDAEGIFSDELLAEADPYDELGEEIDAQQEQLLAQAKGLANQQDRERVYSETYAEEFAQGVKNHEQSVKAMREYQAEIGATGPEMEALLVGIDVELSNGLLGQPLDLDQVAISDPKLFQAAIRSAGSVILQDLDEEDAQALKQRILGQQHDIADGLVIGGQPVKAQQQPVFNEERYINAVARRSKKGHFDGPVNLPAERSIRDGFTLDGRPIHPDDLPLGGGGTARSKLAKEMREGRSS